MKNGFRDTVDKILRKYGMKTIGTIGTVWSSGDYSWLVLNAMGYRVERGIDKPDYDYIILSQKKSTLENILKALTLIKLGCIIVFRADGNRQLIEFLKMMNKINGHLETSFYGYGEDKVLGVILKGK